MDKPLDHVIPGAADRDQVSACAVYRLMVGGVYFAAVSVELVKEIAPSEIAVKNIVKLVAPNPSVGFGGVDMLRDVAAEMDVDELEPFADAEYGLFLRRETGEDVELQDIKFCVNVVGAVVGLTEKGRRDVAAAWEKKMRGVVRLTGIQTDRAGNAHPSYCVFIVSGVFGTTGDQYGGSGHGGFLPAESYFILCTSIRTVHKIMVALSGENLYNFRYN